MRRMTRLVGQQDRSEFIMDPVQALRRGRVLDRMSSAFAPPRPRGVIRATHLAAAIEAESRGRKISKSDVVRERLQFASGAARESVAPPRVIADLIGSVDGLPADLSAAKKRYLRGRKRPR